MSNNTTTNTVDASDILFSDAYLLWLEKDLFPYVFGSCGVVILILGVICNAILAKVYHKRGADGATAITSQMIVGDIIAYLLVIAPGIYFSFSKSTTFTGKFCEINGIGVVLAFVSQFGFLTVCLGLSLFTLRKRPNSSGLFQRKSVIVVCSIIVWVTTLLLAVVPFVTSSKYEYNAAEYQCRTDRKTLHLLMNVAFFLTLFLSLIIGTVNFFVTVYTHLKGKSQTSSETTDIQNADGIKLVKTNNTSGHNDKAKTLADNASEGKDQNTSSSPKTEQSSTPKDTQDMINETNNRDGNNGTKAIKVSQTDSLKSVNVPAEPNKRELTPVENTGPSLLSDPDNAISSINEGTEDIAEVTERDKYVQPTTADIKDGDDALTSSAKSSSTDRAITVTPVTPLGDKSAGDPDETNHSLQSTSNNSRIRLTPSNAANSKQFKLRNKWKVVSKKIGTLNRMTDKFASRSRVAETFSDLSKLLEESSVKNTDIHVCISYLTTWVTVFLLWMPYLLISYVDAYGSTWWNGWYTIAVFCANCSYCVKPIVLLASKKDLRKDSEAVMPGKVSKNANSVKSVVNRIMR